MNRDRGDLPLCEPCQTGNGVDQNREKGGGRVAYFQAHLQAKHAFLVVVMLFDGGETHARWDVMWFKGESP